MSTHTLDFVWRSWPLTGRAEGMRVIQAAISDQDAAGIVVCGSAGVGNSRIAREALRSAAADGYRDVASRAWRDRRTDVRA